MGVVDDDGRRRWQHEREELLDDLSGALGTEARIDGDRLGRRLDRHVHDVGEQRQLGHERRVDADDGPEQRVGQVGGPELLAQPEEPAHGVAQGAVRDVGRVRLAAQHEGVDGGGAGERLGDEPRLAEAARADDGEHGVLASALERGAHRVQLGVAPLQRQTAAVHVARCRSRGRRSRRGSGSTCPSR